MAIPFWVVGHVHLSINTYQDIHEIIASLGLNILVAIGFIIDYKKNSGWIHVSQLKKVNSAIAVEDKVLFKKPTIFSEPIANIKKGRLLVVQKCLLEWCKVETKACSSLPYATTIL